MPSAWPAMDSRWAFSDLMLVASIFDRDFLSSGAGYGDCLGTQCLKDPINQRFGILLRVIA